MENDPIERLRMFPGSTAEQIIALTDLWKQRAKRTFVAIRERINELDDLQVKVEPAAFDNYFRRSNRERTPEAVVWALIYVMRDDTWLPKDQQCTLAEAIYLATLKNVSVTTYARIYTLFPGQEEEFKRLCPLGDLIVERARIEQPAAERNTAIVSLFYLPWVRKVAVLLLLILIALIVWTFLSLIGWKPL